MAKVTLDISTFKALASDSRLSILKALDGKRMSLKDISDETNLNKATLHEHLTKLNEAGLVKRKEREGHKWVYYKLTWKGECLLHPENTRVVVMFSMAFLSICVGVVSLVNFVKGKVIGWSNTVYSSTHLYKANESGGMLTGKVSPSSEPFTELQNKTAETVSKSYGVEANDLGMRTVEMGEKTYGATVADTAGSVEMVIWHNPLFQQIAIVCFVVSILLIAIAVWRYWKNYKIKL
ncbi:MAG: winged helix-turn-helix domain-containing protein [Candidatus Thermoplasmatota archaeon]